MAKPLIGLWPSSKQPDGTPSTDYDEFLRLQTLTAHDFDYYRSRGGRGKFDSATVKTGEAALAAAGRKFSLELNPRTIYTGSTLAVPYTEVASGLWDDDLRAIIHGGTMPTSGTVVSADLALINFPGTDHLFEVHSEANIQQPVGYPQPAAGTSAEYRAFYEYIYNFFVDEGITVGPGNQLLFCTSLTRSVYDNETWEPWIPDNLDHVHILGVDGYSHPQTAKARGWWEMFDGPYAKILTLGKQMAVTETATEEALGDPTYKETWFLDAWRQLETLDRNNLFLAFWTNEFTTPPSSLSTDGCIESSTTATDAFIAGWDIFLTPPVHVERLDNSVTINSNTDATSYSSSAGTLPASALVLVFVNNTDTVTPGTPEPRIMSGPGAPWGLTWHEGATIASQMNPPLWERGTLYWAVTASDHDEGLSDSFDVNFSGSTGNQTSCILRVVTYTNSGGARPGIAQIVTDQNMVASDFLLTTMDPLGPSSAVEVGLHINGNAPPGVATDAGWVLRYNIGHSSPRDGLIGISSNEVTSDYSPSAHFSDRVWTAIAAEISNIALTRQGVVTHLNMSVPADPRSGEATFAEVEVPDITRGARLTFAEFETPITLVRTDTTAFLADTSNLTHYVSAAATLPKSALILAWVNNTDTAVAAAPVLVEHAPWGLTWTVGPTVSQSLDGINWNRITLCYAATDAGFNDALSDTFDVDLSTGTGNQTGCNIQVVTYTGDPALVPFIVQMVTDYDLTPSDVDIVGLSQLGGSSAVEGAFITNGTGGGGTPGTGWLKPYTRSYTSPAQLLVGLVSEHINGLTEPNLDLTVDKAWAGIAIEVSAISLDRDGRSSFAELEAPLAPRRGRASFSELQTPLVPRAGRVTFTELEIMPAGLLSFAELRVPGGSPRKGRVAWALFQTGVEGILFPPVRTLDFPTVDRWHRLGIHYW